MNTERIDTRQHILDCGHRLVARKGFVGVGLAELLTTAGVPKGSFYHYFASKEAFGLALIERYAHFFARKLDRHLLCAELTPLARVQAFVDDAQAGMARYDYRRGCLIGNLGQEMGALPESFRAQLQAVFADWQARLAACLRLAQQAGEMSATADAEQLAAFFWIGWEGAVLRAKLAQSAEPLTVFARFFLAGLPR